MTDVKFDIDINRHEPLYVQVKNQLRDEILKGRFESFTKLPSVRKLATDADVSVGTMSRVVSDLVDEGVCIQRPGIGIYVNRSSALSGQKLIIHLQEKRLSSADGYARTVLQIENGLLYPRCTIQSWYFQPDSHAFNTYIEKLQSERPDCLLVEAPGLSREEVETLIKLPFPVLFLCHLNFGELDNPDMNIVHEDCLQHGYELVRAVMKLEGKTAAVFGGDPRNYYVKRLRDGADLASREFGVDLRYYRLVDDDARYWELNQDEIRQMKTRHMEAMLQDGLPDVIVFEGHTEIAEQTELLSAMGLEAGKDFKLLSDRELVPGGVFLQRDYTKFREECAKLIMRMANDRKYHPGLVVLNGTIRYFLSCLL